MAGTSGCGGGAAGVEKGWWTAGKVVEATGVLLGPLLYAAEAVEVGRSGTSCEAHRACARAER